MMTHTTYRQLRDALILAVQALGRHGDEETVLQIQAILNKTAEVRLDRTD